MLKQLFLIYLLLINICAFTMMFADKLFSKKRMRRIPESTLIFCGVLGGSIGGLLGMYLFRYKTKHRKFTIGLPLILFLQVAAVIVLKFAM